MLAWMCQRDSEVATCRTMTLMESMWMEKSWGEGAAVRDVREQHSPQQPLTEPVSHLAKEPQQGGFKSQVCSAFISINFSGSLQDGRLEPTALLEICADSHLAKTQLEVAPAEEQHGQLLQELTHGIPNPIARDAPPPWECAGSAQGHPQDTATSKKSDSLPHRADHGERGTAERCKGSRTAVSGARDKPDPPKRAGKEPGQRYVRQLPAQFTGDPDVVDLLQGRTGRSEKKQPGSAS